ncbi:CLUMA_CG018683, isoform A [Clunio marinus]|uniref:CLUMA_CG018683, isoform A n=1 Tax=Clunio marinus TaxID=568069 RepID=A0A1J1IZT1_9DIPT|nr:CLUMA_CG018683, isoform A [Clunio marinus]
MGNFKEKHQQRKSELAMKLVCFIILIFFSSSSDAQYELPEGTTCDDFCEINSNIDPSQVHDIYYLTDLIPYFFDVDVSCTYINVSKPDENGMQFFQRIERYKGEHRETGGSFIINDSAVELVFSDLGLPFSGKFLAITPNIIAFVYCNDCGFFEKEGAGVYIYIFSKLAFPECDDLNPIMDVFDKCGIPSSEFTKVGQSNCNEC